MCDTFNFQSVNFFCHMPHQMRVLLLLLVASFGFVPQVHGESTPEVAVEDQTDAGEEQDAFEGVPEDQEVDMESLFTALFEGKKRKNELFVRTVTAFSVDPVSAGTSRTCSAVASNTGRHSARPKFGPIYFT